MNTHIGSLRPALAVALLVVLCGTSTSHADDPQAAEKEKQLIAILRSDAPAAEKAITCKQLAVFGSPEAVPDLAKLLPDEQLSSWARIALEAIPGSAADEALRTALENVQGRLLIGMINSIGVRKDAGSTAALIERLKDQDVQVASAAAVALGHIGNADATKSLRAALKSSAGALSSAVAEGCVLCAERCVADGRQQEAAEIYEEIRQADVPKQRKIEATRGVILARGNGGIPVLSELLQSSDKALFQLALGIAREFPGTQIDQALATELGRATPERAALIVVAMADRKDSVVLPAVLKAAESGPLSVRLAAIAALGRVGNVTCLAPLLEIARAGDTELVAAAKTALTDLPGENVDKEILSRLAKAEGASYPLLIELVGTRRLDALSDLLKALENGDAKIRQAALTSLGHTVPANSLSVLVSQVTSPKNAADAPIAREALQVAAIRMPDREACALQLASAMKQSPATTKPVLLEILGAVGGTNALQTLGAAAKSNDGQLQDTSTRLLGEWMTADAAPVLLDVAKSAPGEKYQVRALRGYIRIARQFVMPDAQRAEMCDKAFEAAKYPTERKLVLDVLKRYPTAPMAPIALQAVRDPELAQDAREAVLLIAQKSGKAVNVPELLSKAGLSKVKVEIVKAEYGAGNTQRDVTATLQRQARDLPLITLPGATYNTSFGGDPAPGQPKKLKVQYRINGQTGEASFAENDVIMLPMPK